LDVVLVVFRDQAAGECVELRKLVTLFGEKDININTILVYVAKGRPVAQLGESRESLNPFALLHVTMGWWLSFSAIHPRATWAIQTW
jgi:hypothetical protein